MYKDTDRQAPLFDARSLMSASSRRRLESTWADGFARDVYPILLELESEFAGLYGSVGRPNWSVARLLGVCLLQELLGLCDQQAVDALTFDARWRYALGFGADDDSYLSRQGLVEFRSRLVRNDPDANLLGALFERLTQEALQSLDLSTTRQRVDSSLIQSNIRERGQVDLLLTTLRHALRAVQRADEVALSSLSQSLQDWYEEKNEGRGWFGDKGSRLALKQVGEWLYEFVIRFAAHEELGKLDEVQLARRALLENFDFDPDPEPEGGERVEVTAKPHSVKVEHPTTLQSPYDPDAGKGHKGRGYSLHIVETCGNQRAELITAFELHPANQPDQGQAQPLIEKLSAQGKQPQTLYADAGYITPTSVASAQSSGTNLHGPMYKREIQHGLNRLDFEYDEEGKVRRCPEGHEPIRHTQRQYERTGERHPHALFDVHICQRCPRQSECPVTVRKVDAHLALVPRLHLRAQRWREQEATSWWLEYAIRSGIEATISEVKRAHKCQKLRVRTRPRVKTAVTFKLTACNMKRWLRAAASERRLTPLQRNQNPLEALKRVSWRSSSEIRNTRVAVS